MAQKRMAGDLSKISKLCLITGRTDMRLSINGLMAIIQDAYQMDSYANTLYLFYGRKTDWLRSRGKRKEQKDAQIQELSKTVEELRATVVNLNETLEEFRRKFFGKVGWNTSE